MALLPFALCILIFWVVFKLFWNNYSGTYSDIQREEFCNTVNFTSTLEKSCLIIFSIFLVTEKLITTSVLCVSIINLLNLYFKSYIKLNFFFKGH